MLPSKLKEKYSTKEEATEAAKKYLRENPSETRVPIQEMDEEGLGKRGRMVFHLGEYFHYVDTEWIK
jgi:phenylpyruvate tautomerase PptA (4-oxalocrotonate tautomerase family)